MSVDVEDLVNKYVAIRDRKAEIVAENKAKVAKFDTALDQLEAKLLVALNAQQAESVRTTAGTCYKSTKSYVSVADWPALLDYIKANEAWSMLKKDVAKATVEAFKEENGDLPPGLNWREEVVINVRRA